jgi:hypothetical protein
MEMCDMTEAQRTAFLRFVGDALEAALEEVEMDGAALERLLGKKKELQACFVSAIRELSVNEQYADEEVASDYGYLSGYSPKPLAGQIATLKTLFPELKGANEELLAKIERDEVALPDGAEGWFAIPRWQSVAKTYGEALQKALGLLKNQREGRFYNYREGLLGEQYLRRHERTEKALSVLGDEQKGYDILVVAAQFGLKHRGRSVRRARVVFAANEFGLGAFEVGCMILTHQNRLANHNDLWIDCAGDEYAPEAAGVWSCAPYFRFGDGAVRFDAGGGGHAYGYDGSASGFAAQ